ncbi:serine hydrolase domain-containing protein [Nonomuraea sediminis]|uniref:serine hydrolase domain-containing protein n=1 Tax=Nonomuraea sediminis TaxID=2835864 RepID=UPI001BDBE7CA|nr:serine hydrolase domain-containing protein [Nonomuraea sediminis]
MIAALVMALVMSTAGPLQQDVGAIKATGVLAEVQTPQGARTARSGVAELGSGRPVPWNAYYRVGSDTKTFTATVALQLVGEGRLALTEPVGKWLPDLVPDRRITVEDLLRQTSGLHDYLEDLPIAQDLTPKGYLKNRFTSYPPRRLVERAVRKPARPGWSYSNTNYVLAGMIIEKVTGHPWAQEIHRRILEPLGLRHTFTPGTSAYVPEPTARAYTYFPGAGDPVDTSLFAVNGADGGIVSTPHDLAVFLRALMGGRLLRPAQLAQMKQTVEAKDWIDVPGVRYGLGIAWRPVPGCPDGIWFHGGTSFGTVSESGVTPDGSRAAATAAFTLHFSKAQQAQDRAARALVDHALCAPGER